MIFRMWQWLATQIMTKQGIWKATALDLWIKAIFTFSFRRFFPSIKKPLKHVFILLYFNRMNNERRKDTQTTKLNIEINNLLLYMKQVAWMSNFVCLLSYKVQMQINYCLKSGGKFHASIKLILLICQFSEDYHLYECMTLIINFHLCID